MYIYIEGETENDHKSEAKLTSLEMRGRTTPKKVTINFIVVINIDPYIFGLNECEFPFYMIILFFS